MQLNNNNNDTVNIWESSNSVRFEYIARMYDLLSPTQTHTRTIPYQHNNISFRGAFIRQSVLLKHTSTTLFFSSPRTKKKNELVANVIDEHSHKSTKKNRIN